MSESKVLFLVTGSIAAYKSAFVISRLVQSDVQVQVACSEGALNFVGEGTFEGLTGKPVYKNIYEPGRMMGHIDLAKWADLAIICPATGRTINALASGTAEDPIGSLFLAYNLKEKPFLVAPAMNQQMYQHPSIVQSLGTLEKWGVKILPTDSGHQACGDEGAGRLLLPDKIFDIIMSELRR
jgi:phosphopantothenoylcysteine synthetase/decarboxylase